MDEPLRRRIGGRLFLAFSLLYLLTAAGRVQSDDMFHYEQVQVFVDSGAFVMSPLRDPEALKAMELAQEARALVL